MRTEQSKERVCGEIQTLGLCPFSMAHDDPMGPTVDWANVSSYFFLLDIFASDQCAIRIKQYQEKKVKKSNNNK